MRAPHHAFQGLQAVVVDEWHGALTKQRRPNRLCLARLRQWRPSLQTWGLSATLGNLHEAMQALLGSELDGRLICATSSQLQGPDPDAEAVEVFPWAGHLGQRMVEQVVEAIEAEKTTLVFTNVRSQAEWWFQAILQKRSEWEGGGSASRISREKRSTWKSNSDFLQEDPGGGVHLQFGLRSRFFTGRSGDPNWRTQRRGAAASTCRAQWASTRSHQSHSLCSNPCHGDSGVCRCQRGHEARSHRIA